MQGKPGRLEDADGVPGEGHQPAALAPVADLENGDLARLDDPEHLFGHPAVPVQELGISPDRRGLAGNPLVLLYIMVGRTGQDQVHAVGRNADQVGGILVENLPGKVRVGPSLTGLSHKFAVSGDDVVNNNFAAQEVGHKADIGPVAEGVQDHFPGPAPVFEAEPRDGRGKVAGVELGMVGRFR